MNNSGTNNLFSWCSMIEKWFFFFKCFFQKWKFCERFSLWNSTYRFTADKYMIYDSLAAASIVFFPHHSCHKFMKAIMSSYFFLVMSSFRLVEFRFIMGFIRFVLSSRPVKYKNMLKLKIARYVDSRKKMQ